MAQKSEYEQKDENAYNEIDKVNNQSKHNGSINIGILQEILEVFKEEG